MKYNLLIVKECITNKDVIGWLVTGIGAVGSIIACVVAVITIIANFNNQKYHKILDSIQCFYMKLLQNLKLIEPYFEGEIEECILTYFCDNYAYSSTHKLVDRLAFEERRNLIIKLLSESDHYLYNNQLKSYSKKKSKNANIDILNNYINKLFDLLIKLKGIIPLTDKLSDNDYFNSPYRPIYYRNSTESKGEQCAFEEAKYIADLIKKITNQVNVLIQIYF